MIRTTAQLIELIKRTLEKATPEQKRQLCEALGLPGFPEQKQAECEPALARLELTEQDQQLLREMGIRV